MTIKATITLGTPPQAPYKYPCLMLEDTGGVIYFECEGRGMLIALGAGSDRHYLGKMVNRVIGLYAPFYGTVTLDGGVY